MRAGDYSLLIASDLPSAPPPLPDTSAITREQTLTALAQREFDVLVVGGGITGAGIARDAALRGMSVALVERNDFASGTSSRSSRLIHGGLRYLEHGYLKLVHEASTERRRLLQLAPDLVRPLAFTWPVYRGARVPKWKLRAGLFLYDLLAMFRNVKRHRGLGVQELRGLEPALRSEGLVGGAVYYDAATDDARLTLANVLGARDAGAVVANHVNVEELIIEGSRIAGAKVRDTIGGGELSIGARVVVNATGPWSDELRALAGDRSARGVRGSKGTHISVPTERVGNKGALTLLSPADDRVFFVLPSGAKTIVGTTDTFTDESPDGVRPSEADVDYLIASANHFFPDARLTGSDVESAWAGLRPLVASSAGGGESGASREHAIAVSEKGLVTISGGKLTTYRVMAEQVVDCVERRLGRAHVRAVTHELPLAGTRSSSVEDAVTKEMAVTLGDVLVRRTHMAFASRDHGVDMSRSVADTMQRLLGWSDEQKARAIEEYALEVARMFSVR